MLVIFLTLALRGRRAKAVGAADQQHGESAPPKRQGRLVLLFTVLGAVSATALLPYLMPVIQNSMNGMHLPLAGKAAITVAQVTLLTLAASSFGLILASKVGLGTPLLHYWLYGGKKVALSLRWLGIGALGSLVGTVVIVLMEKLFFKCNFRN